MAALMAGWQEVMGVLKIRIWGALDVEDVLIVAAGIVVVVLDRLA